jgi:hypothetical protein
MQENLFKDLKKEVLEIHDRFPKLSLDNTFVVWFIRAFVIEDEMSAVNALQGGSGDKGVDAIYVDHESRAVFLIQGKYRQGIKIPSEKRSDVIALADLGRALLLDNNETLKTILENAHENVKQALEESRSAIQRRNYRLNLQFVTTGKASSTHKAEAEQRIEDWSNASFECFSRADLLRLMKDYQVGASPPIPTITLPIQSHEAFNRYDDTTNITSWIFTMKSRDIVKIYNEHGIRLFSRNIRGFLGNTDINRGMQVTLKEEPEYFWYFNNGITIVCDEAKQITDKGKKYLRVFNAQIINGQQTTRSLALKEDSNADVLIKLLEVPKDTSDGYQKYSHIISEIVSATNWQNAITASDLKSNDIEQVRIEREMRKLNYQYLRKRMNKAEAKKASRGRYKWIIKKEDLATSIGACVLDPYEIRLGKNRLFEDDVYYKIFDGRTAADYLTIYWLNRLVTYWSIGYSGRGYAKWIVLNFVWLKLGNYLKRSGLREKFRYAAERAGTYWWELKPLDSISVSTFLAAMAFYRANKRLDGKVFDESSFFKHSGLHKDFEKYWNRQSSKHRKVFKEKMKEFIKRINDVEI